VRLGGFEPPTRGLEVDADGLAGVGVTWPSRMVMGNRLASHRTLWHLPVDPLLTRRGRLQRVRESLARS
jgi:hypothetical protein